jgi:hypothetical protein
MLNITPTQLRKATDLQEKIQKLQYELNEILGSDVPCCFGKRAQPAGRSVVA